MTAREERVRDLAEKLWVWTEEWNNLPEDSPEPGLMVYLAERVVDDSAEAAHVAAGGVLDEGAGS